MSERQIIRDTAHYSENDDLSNRWSMVVDGETVSELWVEIATGEIMQVETPKAHQGNGYASSLYRAAAAEITIYHAPVSHRSYEGNRFAESVGGPTASCPTDCYCTPANEED